MFSYFVQGVEKVFERNIRDYALATLKTKHIHVEYLEDFLHENSLPFSAKGFDIATKREMPIRYSLSAGLDAGLRKEQGYGFYCLFPLSENEIFFCFCESGDVRTETLAFVAYKNWESLQKILIGLKEYYKTEKSVGQKVFSQGKKEMIKENIYWDDIILPDALKNDIRICVENFMKGKHIYQKAGIPYKRGLLFTGTPGNGKTMLCKIIACESRLPFVLFTFDAEPTDHDIELAFEKAAELSPAILCFDDLDSIGNSRQTLSKFLNKLDGFEPLDGILILATANKPEETDPALCSRPSRFDRILRIPKPDYQCRLLMIKRYTGNLFMEKTLKDVASETDDFSMAYLKELYIYSAMIALEKGFTVPSEEDLFQALETLKHQLRNGFKPSG